MPNPSIVLNFKTPCILRHVGLGVPLTGRTNLVCSVNNFRWWRARLAPLFLQQFSHTLILWFTGHLMNPSTPRRWRLPNLWFVRVSLSALGPVSEGDTSSSPHRALLGVRGRGESRHSSFAAFSQSKYAPESSGLLRCHGLGQRVRRLTLRRYVLELDLFVLDQFTYVVVSDFNMLRITCREFRTGNCKRSL